LAVGRGLPDIEDGTGDRLAGLHVPNGTVHEGDTAIRVRVLDDAVAESTERGIGRPEGTENNVGGGGDAIFGDNFVGNLIDETSKSVSDCFLFFFQQ
jgi:hypothetical protein